MGCWFWVIILYFYDKFDYRVFRSWTVAQRDHEFFADVSAPVSDSGCVMGHQSVHCEMKKRQGVALAL